MDKKSTFSLFMQKIQDFPVWVKQIICLKLFEELQAQVCDEFLRLNSENIFSAYKPILTYKGREELLKHNSGMDLNIYNFLSYCENDMSIIEISLNTFLSLEEVAKYFIFCVSQNFIENPDNVEISAMAGFVAGKFRTGEYFAQKGMIDENQLNKAIIESKNSNKKFAQILVDLGFITQKDVRMMLAIKENSQKRFILDYNDITKTKFEYCSEKDKYINEIESIKRENELLKKKISQLYKIIKQYN